MFDLSSGVEDDAGFGFGGLRRANDFALRILRFDSIAYKKWIEDKDCGPKALGVFGSSYLWSVFREIDGRDDKKIAAQMEDI